jgi:hypothetical protein
VVSGQEFPVAALAELVDPTPTPFAVAVVPACELPPESTPVEVDARIDRLLREHLDLLRERTALRENLTATQNRSTKCLEEARKAKKLARALIEATEIGASDDAYDALRDWAAEDL